MLFSDFAEGSKFSDTRLGRLAPVVRCVGEAVKQQ